MDEFLRQENEERTEGIISSICSELFSSANRHLVCLNIVKYWLYETALPFINGFSNRVKKSEYHVHLILSALMWADIDFQLSLIVPSVVNEKNRSIEKVQVLLQFFKLPRVIVKGVCDIDLLHDFQLGIPLDMIGDGNNIRSLCRVLSDDSLALFNLYQKDKGVNNTIHCSSFRYNKFWEAHFKRNILMQSVFDVILVSGLINSSFSESLHALHYILQKNVLEITKVMNTKGYGDKLATASTLGTNVEEWQYDPTIIRKREEEEKWQKTSEAELSVEKWSRELTIEEELEEFIIQQRLRLFNELWSVRDTSEEEFCLSESDVQITANLLLRYVDITNEWKGKSELSKEDVQKTIDSTIQIPDLGKEELKGILEVWMEKLPTKEKLLLESSKVEKSKKVEEPIDIANILKSEEERRLERHSEKARYTNSRKFCALLLNQITEKSQEEIVEFLAREGGEIVYEFLQTNLQIKVAS